MAGRGGGGGAGNAPGDCAVKGALAVAVAPGSRHPSHQADAISDPGMRFEVARKSRPEIGGFRTAGIGAQRVAARRASAGTAASPSNASSENDNGQGAKQRNVHFVERLPFNFAVAAITFLNIIAIAVEMDTGPGLSATMVDRIGWYMVEGFFNICFVVELFCRIKHGRLRFFADTWNVLDTLLVGLAIFDFFMLSPIGAGGRIRLFTVLRVLRTIKLVRLMRMFSSVRELWFLVGGITNSVKALGWVGCVVLVVLYVCSIVVTTEIGQNDSIYGIGPSYDGEVWQYKEYFGTVFRSMFSLFQVMTLDAWCDNIVRHVMYRQPLMGVFFIVFVFFMAFGLMNIVVGIIVENTLAAAAVSDARITQQKGEAKKEAVERLYSVLAKSDVDRTGEISMEEMRAAYQSKVVQAQFEIIGIGMEEVQELFKLLDYEQRGRVELERFADSCRELVGGKKRRDLAQMEVTVGALAQHLERLDTQFARIENDISDLTRMADHFVHNTVRVLTGFDGSVKVPPKPGSPTASSGFGPPTHASPFGSPTPPAVPTSLPGRPPR